METIHSVPESYARRARSAYAWDTTHYTKIYSDGYNGKLIGYDVMPEHEGNAIRELTRILGGFEVGDFVWVPNHLFGAGELNITRTSDQFSGVKGCARLRIVRVHEGGVVERFDPDNPHIKAETDDGKIAVIRPDSFDATHQIAMVPADECWYAI